MLHFRTQEGQPYGSESRKCSWCGVMIWPGMGEVPDYTTSEKEWNESPNNCFKAHYKEREDA